MAADKIFWFFGLFLLAESRYLELIGGAEPFTLNEFFAGVHSSRTFNGSWISGNTFLYRSRQGDYLEFDATDATSKPFASRSILTNYPGGAISVSKDLKYISIRYNVSSVFRHSTTAIYAIYNRETEQFFDIANKSPIQLLTWAPLGHILVYVKDNNIYYLDNPENAANPRALTTDGVPGIIYNGVPDWVYEEEVFGSGSALWFSPDAKHLAFASFNDTEVQEMDYLVYESPDKSDSQYPTLVTLRYPKVGTTNPTVKVFSVNLESPSEIIEIHPIPEQFLANDNYVLYDITWQTNNEIAVISTNRVQNESELVKCVLGDYCYKQASYKAERGWVDARLPKYSKDGTLRLEIIAQPQGQDQYDHLALINSLTGEVTRLTQGEFVVTSIYGWDENNGLVYFAGSLPNTPSQQHVQVVSLITGQTNCLTCLMDTCAGVCKYAAATFSPDLSNWMRVCQGPGPFLVEIKRTTGTIELAPETIVWEDNQAVVELLLTKSLPLIKDFKVPVANGFVADVRLLLPPDFDEASPQKYPAVVNVYGGPNSNQIRDSYSAGFQNYIVTNRKYIYIYIDGRGSGRGGKSKLFQIYRGMGTVEIEDQIAVTKYLQDHLHYIDADNTGIWGWSYGGFASAWALAKDRENVFKFALAVAPVTSFIYYDSIYTERYMGLPTEDDNLAGYNNTDVTRNVEGMRGKLFLLIHGNADDNVHYQQSMLLSKALELADISFRQQSYPDENHSLTHVYPHLYHTIDRFWARSFGLPDPPAPPVVRKEIQA